LAEFEIKQKRLVHALSLLSKITPTTAVGVLEDSGGRKGGIAFSRGMAHIGPEFSTMLYAHFPLFEIDEFDKNGDLKDFKAHVAEWPLVLIPSTQLFIEAVALLPTRDDFLHVRLVRVKVEEEPNLIETQIIISGEGNAHTGAGMKHPLEISDNVGDQFSHYA
jgi:hypothetical protein